VDDPSVDIFGNKKRGGGGDPIKNGGVIVPNASAVHRYQAFQDNLVKSSSAATAPLNTSNEPTNTTPMARPREKTADELFREDLYRQIEEQKKAKYMAKLKEMEADRMEQERVKREIAALREKHAAEIKSEHPDGGFVRFSNSHSHIPPPPHHDPVSSVAVEAAAAPKPAAPSFPSKLPTFGLPKEAEKENVTLSRLSELVQAMKPMAPSPIPSVSVPSAVAPAPVTKNRDSRSMELLERQVIEQELELKRLRLQMLEQQNDQKTTLQYLLRLQTDFTEKIQQSNHQNVVNIRRPLSAVTALSNITRAPPTPEISEAALLRQIQNHRDFRPAAVSRSESPLHSFDAGHPISRVVSPPNQEVRASIISQSALNQIRQPLSSYFPPRPVDGDHAVAVPSAASEPDRGTPSPPKPPRHALPPQRVQPRSPAIRSKYIQDRQLMAHQPRPRQHTAPQSLIPSQDSSPARSVVVGQQSHSAHAERPGIASKPQMTPRRPQQPTHCAPSALSAPRTRSSSAYPSPMHFVSHSPFPQQLPSPQQPFRVHLAQRPQVRSQYVSPPKRAESDQKEESFLMVDSEPPPPKSGGPKLLRNESAFLLCSDDEDTAAVDAVDGLRGDGQALRSSTQFELSSRPTTAIPIDAIREFGDRIAERPRPRSMGKELDAVRCSNASYSSFIAPEHEAADDDDPFAVHIVGDDSMQCLTPPMDPNAVNDSVLTVNEVASDGDDEIEDIEELKVSQEIVLSAENEAQRDEEWKRMTESDRDDVAILRDAFAEIAKDDECPITVLEEESSSRDAVEENLPTATPSKKSALFVAKRVERKEQDEDSEVDYEEDFEEPDEAEMGIAGGEPAVFRVPALDSSINNFQSKVYSVYSSFDDTLMTHSVASSSDLGHHYIECARHSKAACKTIAE